MSAAMMPAPCGVLQVEVVKPGLLTTVQDLGRFGHQRLGVPVAGAMDEVSHRIANILVGNPADAATLEITLMGPSLRFAGSTMIAVAGADLSPRVGDEALPMETSVRIDEDMQLDFGRRVSGMRAYLAVRGGFTVPEVMGSRSTYLRGKFGGFEGRALRQGDVLPCHPGSTDRRVAPAEEVAPGRPTVLAVSPWRPPALRGGSALPSTVRLIEGSHWPLFTPDARRALYSNDFKLSPQSDRMGYRFDGPTLALSEPLELVSEAVTFGTIQVPADGRPIVLMADRQTTGGYPKIASVASVDLPILAQMMPGESVRFAPVSLAEAQRLDRARTQALTDLERRMASS